MTKTKQWKTLGLIAAIVGITAVGSYTLAIAAQDAHNCIHCLKNNNSCCPSMKAPEGESKEATHNCQHCAEQNRACCPHGKEDNAK